MFKWVGEGVLKRRVPVNVDLDEVAERVCRQHQETCERLIHNDINDKARELGYESELSLCSYAGVENQYQKEAQNFIKWKANCWSVLRDYFSSIADKPSECLSVEQIMHMIPKYN
jgi:hypothetical protein